MKTHNTQNASSKQNYWSNHISCWEKSDLTQRQYCLREGIAISTFSYWIRKFGKDGGNQCPTRFFPLAINEAPASPDKKRFHTGIRLSLCNDKFKIDLEKEFSGTTLKRLISTLETI